MFIIESNFISDVLYNIIEGLVVELRNENIHKTPTQIRQRVGGNIWI